MAKKQQKDAKKSQKSLYLSDEIWTRLEMEARKGERSVNSLMEIHFRSYFGIYKS